jgi:hypothetical protein
MATHHHLRLTERLTMAALLTTLNVFVCLVELVYVRHEAPGLSVRVAAVPGHPPHRSAYRVSLTPWSSSCLVHRQRLTPQAYVRRGSVSRCGTDVLDVLAK